MYTFSVFSSMDAPGADSAKPSVEFSGFSMRATGRNEVDLKAYQGLQVSLIEYRDFWSLIDPSKFCAGLSDTELGLASAPGTLLLQKRPGQTFRDADVYTHTVGFSHGFDGHELFARSGVYVLVFSNCGGFADMTVSGSVSVKNAYGFLPATEYPKLAFYQHLMVVYMLLAAAWLVMSMRWWKELLMIQNCIAVVILLGLVETLVWVAFLNHWNSSGRRGHIVFGFAILFTVVKATFSYMLVLVASLGWGITRPLLDSAVIRKLQALSAALAAFSLVREVVLSFKHSHSISAAYIVLCLLPVSLLNGAIFSWVFVALTSVRQTLRERRQFEKLHMFDRLWHTLIAALCAGSLAAFLQIRDLDRSLADTWRHQWLADAIPHLLFLFVLVAMMLLWAPSHGSQRFAYEAPSSARDRRPEKIWDFDDGEDGGEGGGEDSFWLQTKEDPVAGSKAPSARARAQVIGVSTG